MITKKHTHITWSIFLMLLALGLVAMFTADCSGPPEPPEGLDTNPPAGSEAPAAGGGPPAHAHRRVSSVAHPGRVITDEQFTAKLDQVRQQLGPGFRVEIVKPFVVASNQPAKDFDRIHQHTIGWAVKMLNKDFFSDPLQEIIVIYLFRNKESYHRHSQSLFGEKPTTPYGYYLPGHQALVMNIDTGTGTLVHEMVHPLLATDFPQVPSWFDEGLAALYERCHQRDGKIVGLLNWRLPVLQEGLRAGHLVDLEKLLANSRDGFYDDPHGMHYAETRYLCYYLQEKYLLRSFYHEFRKSCSTDPTGRATLLRITGKSSLMQLQSEWLEFLAPLRYGR